VQTAEKIGLHAPVNWTMWNLVRAAAQKAT
jgi:hypothetical protein